MPRTLLPLLLGTCLLLGGCVQAEIEGVLMPDGSGHVRLVARAASGPFGRPLADWANPAWLAARTPPGVVAWSPPRYEKKGMHEEVELVAWFEDANQLQIFLSEDGQAREALGFAVRDGGLLARLGFLDYLDDPLPLPGDWSEKAGMDLSPQRLGQMKPLLHSLLRSLELQLVVRVPGPITRADGFSMVEGREARIHAGPGELIAALTERAGALCPDEAAIAGGLARVDWGPMQVAPAASERHRGQMQAAMQWWGQQDPPTADQ